MTLVDLHLLNAMRAERDAALAENARLRAALGGQISALADDEVLICDVARRHWLDHGLLITRGDPGHLAREAIHTLLALSAALAAPTADDGAEQGVTARSASTSG